jgi:hypothetical protein
LPNIHASSETIPSNTSEPVCLPISRASSEFQRILLIPSSCRRTQILTDIHTSSVIPTNVMSSTQQPHFDSVPKKWEDWAKAARKFGVFRATVHSRQEFRSASKITQDEYLILKVLWPKRLQSSKCKDKLNLGAVYDQAWDWLNTFQPFQVYLDSISHATAPGVSDLGAFEVAFAQQCEARDLMRNPNPLGLKSPNEDNVNASLISLLTAIFVKHPTVNATWTPQRAGLTASFRNGKIECQVDGFLALNANSSTRIVVEVKPRSRQLCEPQVSMQEAAELVAAVTSGPLNGLRRDR